MAPFLLLLRHLRNTGRVGSVAGGHPIGTVQQYTEADAARDSMGETGTGKELIARSIHASSLRRDRLFIRLNCAAIPFDLLESEFLIEEQGPRVQSDAVAYDLSAHFETANLCVIAEFRSDLYYRLNVFPVTLPPLRERRRGIAVLVSRFVEMFSRRIGE